MKKNKKKKCDGCKLEYIVFMVAAKGKKIKLSTPKLKNLPTTACADCGTKSYLIPLNFLVKIKKGKMK